MPWPPANAKEPPLADAFLDAFLRARAAQTPGTERVGDAYAGLYITDKGFEGLVRRGHAQVLTAPKGRTRHRSSKPWRQRLARRRQIIETGNDKLPNELGLSAPRRRRHPLHGQLMHVAATCTLHNLLVGMTLLLGRPRLAFTDLFHC